VYIFLILTKFISTHRYFAKKKLQFYKRGKWEKRTKNREKRTKNGENRTKRIKTKICEKRTKKGGKTNKNES
jgi:hypothetical protein